MTEHQSTYLLLYTGVVAFAILIEAIALVVLALAAAKLMKQVAELTLEAKGKVYPILESVRDITAKGQHIAEVARNVAVDAEPKIKRVTANIADTSDVYRAKVAQVDTLVTDTADKARRQSDRVDEMISSALTRTGEIAANVQHAILAPVRQVSGLVNGAKGTIESLIAQFKPKPRTTPKPVAFEGESIYTGYEDDYHA
jgi:methyl-accepting chemotaxis protein